MFIAYVLPSSRAFFFFFVLLLSVEGIQFMALRPHVRYLSAVLVVLQMLLEDWWLCTSTMTKEAKLQGQFCHYVHPRNS